jgi:hypothetical protein
MFPPNNNNNRTISAFQAHRLLGLSFLPSLVDGKIVKKKQIQEAYRLAALKYHPDSTNPNATPCPIKFQQCHDAKQILLDYYSSEISHRWGGTTADRRQHSAPPYGRDSWAKDKPYHPFVSFQNRTIRKWTWGVKLTVLVLATCDGIYQRRNAKKDNRNITTT